MLKKPNKLLVIKFNELKAKDLKVYKAGVERINLLTEHLDIKNQVRSNNGELIRLDSMIYIQEEDVPLRAVLQAQQ